MSRNIVTKERTNYDAVVRSRLTSRDKRAATRVIENMGLTVSDAIRIMLSLTAKEGRLPFDIGRPMPNETTGAAIEELEAGRGHRSDNVAGMLAELDAEDD
jgi:DNA-damage-inducible protein J